MAEKFGGLRGGKGTDVSKSSEHRGVVRAEATPPPVAPGKRHVPRVSFGATPAFAIALDATGSMAPSLDDARSHIAEILDRVRKLLGRAIKVQFLCYRDYDVFDFRNQFKAELLEVSPTTEDAQTLAAWLANIRAIGGGSNFGEAIETALESIHQTITTGGVNVSAVLLVGDEPSNRRDDLDSIGRSQTQTAHYWASWFGKRKVPIHSFVVKNRDDTVIDFEQIARLSGGKTGRLDGTDSMLNMAALAMVAAVGGDDAVRRYATQHRLSGSEEAFAKLLLKGPTG